MELIPRLYERKPVLRPAGLTLAPELRAALRQLATAEGLNLATLMTMTPNVAQAMRTRLIGAVAQPGDLVVDPAAGSFVVLHAARQLGRNFIGCDLKLPENATRSPVAKTGADE